MSENIKTIFNTSIVDNYNDWYVCKFVIQSNGKIKTLEGVHRFIWLFLGSLKPVQAYYGVNYKTLAKTINAKDLTHATLKNNCIRLLEWQILKREQFSEENLSTLESTSIPLSTYSTCPQLKASLEKYNEFTLSKQLSNLVCVNAYYFKTFQHENHIQVIGVHSEEYKFAVLDADNMTWNESSTLNLEVKRGAFLLLWNAHAYSHAQTDWLEKLRERFNPSYEPKILSRAMEAWCESQDPEAKIEIIDLYAPPLPV